MPRDNNQWQAVSSQFLLEAPVTCYLRHGKVVKTCGYRFKLDRNCRKINNGWCSVQFIEPVNLCPHDVTANKKEKKAGAVTSWSLLISLADRNDSNSYFSCSCSCRLRAGVYVSLGSFRFQTGPNRASFQEELIGFQAPLVTAFSLSKSLPFFYRRDQCYLQESIRLLVFQTKHLLLLLFLDVWSVGVRREAVNDLFLLLCFSSPAVTSYPVRRPGHEIY